MNHPSTKLERRKAAIKKKAPVGKTKDTSDIWHKLEAERLKEMEAEHELRDIALEPDFGTGRIPASAEPY